MIFEILSSSKFHGAIDSIFSKTQEEILTKLSGSSYHSQNSINQPSDRLRILSRAVESIFSKTERKWSFDRIWCSKTGFEDLGHHWAPKIDQFGHFLRESGLENQFVHRIGAHALIWIENWTWNVSATPKVIRIKEKIFFNVIFWYFRSAVSSESKTRFSKIWKFLIFQAFPVDFSSRITPRFQGARTLLYHPWMISIDCGAIWAPRKYDHQGHRRWLFENFRFQTKTLQ